MKALKGSLWAVALGVAVAGPGLAEKRIDETKREVETVKGVSYAKDASERQKIDLYLPKGSKGYPVLVFFHGGGLTKGDRAGVATFGKVLAAQGIGVAAAGYRLARDAKYPASAQDAAAAFAWVRKHASEYGWDASQAFIGGHSAGGILSGILATDESFLKAAGASIKDIRGVVDVSGLYRIPVERKEVFGDEEARKQASAINHVRGGLPAFLVAWAENDTPDRPKDSAAFVAKLEKNKVKVVAYEAKGRDHGSIFAAIKDASDPTGAEIVRFIRSQRATDSTSATRR